MNKNVVAELLPCPFCGGEVKLEQTGRSQLTIKCKSCQIKRVQKVLHYSMDWLEEKMVEAWNKRIPLIAIPGVRELVEQAWRAGCYKGHDWTTDTENEKTCTDYLESLEATDG